MGFFGAIGKALGGAAGGLGSAVAKGPTAMDGPGTGGLAGNLPRNDGVSVGGGFGGMLGRMASRMSAPKPPMAAAPKARTPIRGRGMSNIRTIGRR